MKPAFYTGASGLIAFQSRLDVVGNNIANSNTIAYKPTTTSFNDLLYTEMYVNTQKKSASIPGAICPLVASSKLA